ncbi:MAG: hypothetical protein KBD53_01885 [Candidatus Omnitrophica bacterium]|nr:hypothetical protein [Candidatus Omnitrophota bacterium]
MKKINFLWLALWFILIPHQVQAHPPSDIVMSYDLEKKILSVKMRHTTIDARKDYIRKIEVSVNKGEPIITRYTIQSNTMEFSDNISLPAKEGDTINLKAFSKEGGSTEASLQVPKKEEKKSDTEEPSIAEETIVEAEQPAASAGSVAEGETTSEGGK